MSIFAVQIDLPIVAYARYRFVRHRPSETAWSHRLERGLLSLALPSMSLQLRFWGPSVLRALVDFAPPCYVRGEYG